VEPSSLVEGRTCEIRPLAPNGQTRFQSNCYDDLCFGVFALSVENVSTELGGFPERSHSPRNGVHS